MTRTALRYEIGECIHMCIDARNISKNHQTQIYILALHRRLLMNDRIVMDLEDQMQIVDTSDRADIYINMFVINIAAMCDNIAWALKYQFDLFSDKTDEEIKKKVDIFNPPFRNQLKTIDENITPYWQKGPGAQKTSPVFFGKWYSTFLEKLRHLSAHRIPLLVTQVPKNGEIELQIMAANESLEFHDVEELYFNHLTLNMLLKLLLNFYISNTKRMAVEGEK